MKTLLLAFGRVHLRNRSRFSAMLASGLLVAASAMAELDGKRMLGRDFALTHLPGRTAVLALAQTNDGILFAGSQHLSFLGGRGWERVDVSGEHTFRALASSGSRVFYASENTLGFVERDATGQWQPHSLESALRSAGANTKHRIRSLHATDDGFVAVSPDALLQWTGRRFAVWPVDLPADTRGWSLDDAVHVYQPGAGLLRLGPGGPVPAWTEGALPPGAVLWVTALPSKRWIMGTASGVFLQEASRWKRLPLASQALAGTHATDAVALDDTTVAVATQANGTILLTTDDRLPALGRPGRSTLDPAVHALQVGPDDHLWQATGSGLVRSATPHLYTLIDPGDELGGNPLLSVLADSSHEWLLTARAAFPTASLAATADLDQRIGPRIISHPPDGLARIHHATLWNHRLWLGGTRGLWRESRAGEMELLASSDLPSVERVYASRHDVTHLLPLRDTPSRLLFVSGSVLYQLNEYADGTFVVQALDVPLTEGTISLQEDARGGVWISSLGGRIEHFTWENPGTAEASLRLNYRYTAGSAAWLTSVGDRIYAFTDGSILEVTQTGLAPVPDLAGFIGVAAAPHPTVTATAYWLLRSKALPADASPVLFEAKAGETLMLSPRQTPDLSLLGEIRLLAATPARTSAPLSSATLWIGGNRAALRLGSASLSPPPEPSSARLDRIESMASDGTVQRLPLNPARPLRLPANVEAIQFRFAPHLSAQPAVHYQTRLHGVESDWSAAHADPVRHFTGLAKGSYLLDVRTLDAFGRPGPSQTLSFVLAPAWWQHPFALVGYAATTGLALLGGVQWRMHRLRRLNLRLDRLVRERTRELELSSSAKSVFLENISHEIRNPLHGIVGLIGMLRDESLPPAERDLTRSLRACASHLHRVSEEVLEFSKLEYSEASLTAAPFGLERLIRTVLQQHAALTARQGGSTQLVLPVRWRDGFIGDGPKIATILSNFVVNALKYAPGEPVVLTIELAERDRSELSLTPHADTDQLELSEWVTIEVRDCGPGIPPEEQELIFQKFVRGSKARDGGVPGSGLGLATCRVLARQLGARIGVHSTVGEGATFYLQLPLPRALPRSLLNPPERAPIDQALPMGRALIVEDEDYNRLVLAGMLRPLGYTVDLAADPASARKLLARQRYVVVFLDWELPGATGGDLAQELKSQRGDETPLLIATTAHDGAEFNQRCRAAGMDELLLKPYDQNQVQSAIARSRADRLDGQTRSLDPNALAYYATGNPERSSFAEQDLYVAIARLGETIEAAVRRGDRPALASAAHRLAGLSGTVGARSLNAAARAVSALAASPVTELEPALFALRNALAIFEPARAAG